jgi:hypothetical protein
MQRMSRSVRSGFAGLTQAQHTGGSRIGLSIGLGRHAVANHARSVIAGAVLVLSAAGGCTASRSSGAAAAECCPQGPGLPRADRVRLAEAFRLGQQLGDSVWPGWNEVPFAVLLVAPEQEFLVRHPRPTPDFARIGYDTLLRSEVLVRPRVFPPTLLATFPAVAGVPTVVIGQPGNTGKNGTAWVLTLLHEHLHQMQASRPDYFAGVASLNLARGDETGMWMLNYPFPYDSAIVRDRFRQLALAVGRVLDGLAPVRGAGKPDLTEYLEARERLRASLSDDDYRYFAFQVWQEGVALYTELRFARLAVQRYAPSTAFRSLPGYVSFARMEDELQAEIVRGVRDPDLGRAKRVSFYPLGAANALVLDGVAPDWRDRYFRRMFSLDDYLPGDSTRR